MVLKHQEYEIDDSRQRFDIARVREWLATTYWWGDTATVENVTRACQNSALIVGAYLNGEQVGCCRLVSDKARFAWLGDVFVAPEHRRRGVARAMVSFVVNHPDFQSVSRFMLATRDAHDVYAGIGFTPPPDPQWLMQLRRQVPKAR